MKLTVVGALCVVLIVGTSATAASPAQEPTAYNYHGRFGIPRATAIKKWESENVGKINSNRIVGGWNVDISDFPYQAGLDIQINWIFRSVCGACLISNNRLVTAAHCWRDGLNTANSVNVVLGTSYLYFGGLRIFTTDVIVYPGWNHLTLQADIAAIRIPSIEFTDVIQPISLPSGQTLEWDFTGWQATASGFGFTSNGAGIPIDQALSAVIVPVISPSDCRAFYDHWYHDNNICTDGTDGKGTCRGDSGGPLMTVINDTRTLIGVSSYGSWNGCEAGDPFAFARITSFVSWILSI